LSSLQSIFLRKKGTAENLPVESLILTREETINLIRQKGCSFRDFTTEHGDFERYGGGEVSDWINFQRTEGKSHEQQ